MRKLLLPLSVILLLAGCSSAQMPPSSLSTTPMTTNDPAAIALSEAAVSVSRSLGEIAEVEKAGQPASKKLVNVDRYQLPGVVSIDWSGPIGPLVKKLSKMAGYHFRQIGNPPPVPIIITVSADNTPLRDILKDVDFQAGSRADIRVGDNRHQVVELRYHRA